MNKQICLVLGASAMTFTLLLLSACGEEDIAWETATGTVGVNTADQETRDIQWRTYRDASVIGLDEMTVALESARRRGSVADHGEIDDLGARIDELRRDMAAEFGASREGSEAERGRLERSFEQTRADVDALLKRLGFTPEELARWQDSE
jgi:hypothetical protein